MQVPVGITILKTMLGNLEPEENVMLREISNDNLTPKKKSKATDLFESEDDILYTTEPVPLTEY